MNFEKDEIVILNGGLEYLIVDSIIYNANKYLYLSGLKDEDLVLAKVENRNGTVGLSKLTNDEYSLVLELFYKQMNN